MVKRVDKRGELTSTQLAMIVLAVVGFLIIGFALYKVFNNDSLTNRDLCRLSIVSRATVPGIAQQAVPLNCFTEKVCITVDKSFIDTIKDKFSKSSAVIGASKKSDCKQFAGEENVRIVKVSLDGLGNQEKAKETIQREVANSMYDCWLMTGQGKMDIFKGTVDGGVVKKIADAGLDYADLKVSEIKPSCIVCSRVAFSDALISHPENESLKGIDYNNFMSREKVPGSALTYFQAFTDESVGSGGAVGQGEDKLKEYYSKSPITEEDVEKIKQILIEQGSSKEDVKYLDLVSVKNFFTEKKKQAESSKSKDNQIAIVFTQIKVPSNTKDEQFWNTLQNGAIVGGFGMISGPGKVLSFLTPGAGWLKFVGKIVLVGATSFKFALDAEDATGKNQAFSALTCGKFQSKVSGEEQGCSIVKLVNWDVDTINNLCYNIEGNL